ncbi:MAG: ABC transporter ATP-binding protein [Candidatus Moraniibacteriota bacterium]
MNSSGKPIIKIENLSVVFGQEKVNEIRALDNINLDIYPHELLIIYGPSGCGKSTLLSVISGLQKPTGGKIEFDSRDILFFSEKEKLDLHRHRIGMIFQAFFLVSTLSVIDNVCLPRAFSGKDSSTRNRDGMNLLKRFGIENQAEKFPRDLSGGQRQRVAIARSLINGPSIIVADEPVGNLDSKSAYNVLSILKELNEVDKKLVILVTHDPSHLAYGDRVIHMHDGKIVKVVEVFNKKPLTGIRGDEERQKEQEAMSQEWEAFKVGTLGKAWELQKKGQLDKEWELVKKEKLGKAWKIFQEGKLGEDWELDSEYELVKRKDLAEQRKEQVSPELLMLMRAFKGLSPDQVGTLLIPFKAQQIFSHIFFHIPETQLDLAKKIFQDFISGGITIEDFEARLVEDEVKGGAGWNHYHAKSFISGVQNIFDQVKKIDFTNVEKSSEDIARYLSENFHLKIGEMEQMKFLEYVKMRLDNELAMDEFLGLIDRPVMKGGVGLDRRTAIKVARELEIIILARYSM